MTDWNARAGAAALAACISPADDPLHESRLYAMMHIAVHDARNAIERRSRPYACSAQVPTASPDAAVAAAARDVLVAEISRIPAPFPAACLVAWIASAEASYTAALAVIADGPAKDEGIQCGRAAAAAILGRRAHDGSDTPLIFTGVLQGTGPGEHRYSPGFNFEFAPGWAHVTPFVLERAAQFRSDPPFKVSSKKYAADLRRGMRWRARRQIQGRGDGRALAVLDGSDREACPGELFDHIAGPAREKRPQTGPPQLIA